MAVSSLDDDRFMDVNDAFCAALDYTHAELLGMKSIHGCLLDEAGRGSIAARRAGDGNTGLFSLSIVKKDGSRMIGNCSTMRVTLDGRLCHILTIQDITALKAVEEERKRSELLYRTIVELSPDAVMVTTLDGRILSVNDQAIRLYGLGDHETPQGRSFLDFVTEGEWHRAEGELLKLMFTREPHSSEYRLKRDDGSSFWGEINAKMIPDSAGNPSLILILTRDIAARKRAEEELLSLAVSDELTGLYNRRGFNLAAQQEMKHAHRNVQGLGLLFLDIDGLKNINDLMGHSRGDAALVTVASLLRRSFRDSDIIARWGGDEFVVLALDVPMGCVDTLLDRFQENLALHNGQEPGDLLLSVSVGLASYDPEAPVELDELVRQADKRMYLHKKKKK